MIYQIEKQLKEYGDKVSAEVRGNIESANNALKDALKSEDGDRIKKTIENLEQTAYKLAEEIYKKAGPQAAAGAGAAPGGDRDAAAGGAAAAKASDAKKDEDVIDAEYEVKE